MLFIIEYVKYLILFMMDGAGIFLIIAFLLSFIKEDEEVVFREMDDDLVKDT